VIFGISNHDKIARFKAENAIEKGPGMTKTLVVPGLDGSPAPNWQHWWAATDPEARYVNLSDPLRPTPAAWDIELGSMILQDPDCILVGHSLGELLIARMMVSCSCFTGQPGKDRQLNHLFRRHNPDLIALQQGNLSFEVTISNGKVTTRLPQDDCSRRASSASCRSMYQVCS
jgi:hypothetical protein